MERDTAEIIVKIYAVLFWLGAVAMFAIACIAFGVGVLGMTPNLFVSGQENLLGASIVGGVAVIAAVIFAIFAILYLIVGIGLWMRKAWARIAAVVLSVLSLFSFPFGTLIGAVGIWLFGFEETVKSLFGDAPVRPVKTVTVPAKKKKAAKKKN